MNTVSISLTAVLVVIMAIGWWTGRVTFAYVLLGILTGLALAGTDFGQSVLDTVNSTVDTLSKIGN